VRLRMQRILNSTMADCRFLVYSRRALWFLGLLVAIQSVSFVGTYSSVTAQRDFFVQKVAEYHSHGEELSDALQRPVRVIDKGGGLQSIENPLKYDYIQLSNSVYALDGANLIGTTVDYAAFLLFPLLFVYLGLLLSTFDRQSRTTLLRLSRNRWSDVRLSKVVTVVVVAGATTVALFCIALLASLVTAPMVDDLRHGIGFPVVAPESVSPLWLKGVFAFGCAVFFGLAGLGLGALTRNVTVPLVGVSIVTFAVPIMTRFDPRNALAVIGQSVLDFWGQFKAVPAAPSSPGSALLMLGAWGVAFFLMFRVFFSRFRNLDRS